MKIYTGRGDEGMTDLRDMSRVSKTSARIEAYGTVDEANALTTSTTRSNRSRTNSTSSRPTSRTPTPTRTTRR
mgnify:CR=1 FL=1